MKTVDDYYAITTLRDRRQLVGGAIVVNDEPSLRHAAIQARIVTALSNWSSEHARGLVTTPIDVRLSEHDLYGPDVVWIDDLCPPTDSHGRLLGVPELCVEIRSHSTWHRDRDEKRPGYERGGVPELWLVDDEQERVLVYRRSRASLSEFDIEVEVELDFDGVLTSPQLPGFALPLEDLFRP